MKKIFLILLMLLFLCSCSFINSSTKEDISPGAKPNTMPHGKKASVPQGLVYYCISHPTDELCQGSDK